MSLSKRMRLGRFTAFGHSDVLGVSAARLVGRNISQFCTLTGNSVSASNSFGSIFTTLHRQNLIWRGVVAVTLGDGSQGNFQIFLAPKPAGETGRPRPGGGGIEGTYGLLIDLEAPELQMLAPAAGRAIGLLDPQTGLWSVSAFTEEMERRFNRLDVEGLPGTLILLGFARTPAIGHNAVAAQLGQELRDTSRPTDILGRIDATHLRNVVR